MITQAQLAAYQAAQEQYFKLRDALCTWLANGVPIEPGPLEVHDEVSRDPNTDVSD